MIPILYGRNETAYTSNGLGRLPDAVSCTVNEVLNGQYILNMKYPLRGLHFEDIAQRGQILAKPNDYDDAQPFRISKIKVNAKTGYAVIEAKHKSYDLLGLYVRPFTATGISNVLSLLSSNTIGNVATAYTYTTDIVNTASSVEFTVPRSVRNALGGKDGSILDIFGGEFHWGIDTVGILSRRGADNGVTIRYGKNLEDFQNEQSTDSTYNGILAYYYEKDSDDNVTYVQGSIVYLSGATGFATDCIKLVDASSDFDSTPTVAQLDTYAQTFATENNITGEPIKDNLKVTFVPLWQTEEYGHLTSLEEVQLGDTVRVIYGEYDLSERVIEYTYNVLAERYDSITLGTKKANLLATITGE